eukprot:6194845-Prorocentrum_lima.AAC.1
MEGGVTGAWCLPLRWLRASFFPTLPEKSFRIHEVGTKVQSQDDFFPILIFQCDFVSTPGQLHAQPMSLLSSVAPGM